MARIHILDTNTANQIAAGEVVERPVSVVKELVENAIDAGATKIEVEIREGGVAYLRVTDNGCGMSAEDARLAFVRHATSKISSAEDIFAVSSLGFRGEALPSIASVAKVHLVTREKDAEMGFELSIEGGHEVLAEEVGAVVGTTIEVSDLFYNTPARRKFLKTERTESSRINNMVGKMAMAHADIAFRLKNNGRTVLETPGNGSLQDTIAAIHGKETVADMFPIHAETEDFWIEGAVGKPSLLKSTRQWQTFAVNQRIVESPVLARALDNAYHSLLPKAGYPVAVLMIRIRPEAVDVNVHPQKREVKFVQEQEVFRFVYHAILDALTKVSAPEDIATEVRQVPAAIRKQTTGLTTLPLEEMKPLDSLVREVKSESSRVNTSFSAPSHQPMSQPTVEPIYPISVKQAQQVEDSVHFSEYLKEEASPENALFSLDPEEAPLIPLGQIAKCFIVCQKGEDLYIIDQHAAHERIRYDQLAARTEGIPSQELLVPLLLQMDPADVDVLEERKLEIESLGFVVSRSGPSTLRIEAAPADAQGEDTERMLQEIAVAWREEHPPTAEQLRHRVLAYASCRGAIKSGHVLNIRQMRELIDDLFKTTRPFVCPHGRPVIVRFTPKDLANLFCRS